MTEHREAMARADSRSPNPAADPAVRLSGPRRGGIGAAALVDQVVLRLSRFQDALLGGPAVTLERATDGRLPPRGRPPHSAALVVDGRPSNGRTGHET